MYDPFFLLKHEICKVRGLQAYFTQLLQLLRKKGANLKRNSCPICFVSTFFNVDDFTESRLLFQSDFVSLV